MGLSIDDERRADAAVLRLAGRLDTVTSKILEDHIASHLARGQRRLILELTGVDYVSSYGLRVFLLNAKRLKDADHSFVLCGVTPAVRKILEISGFDCILTIRATIDDVSVSPERPDP